MSPIAAPYSFRLATVLDVATLAQHRASMFRDMGSISDAEADRIYKASIPWFEQLLSSQRYVGWLATYDGEAVAGGGIHLRYLGPAPNCLEGGRSGHIANIYTSPVYRRRGLARSLMHLILRWAEAERLSSLTLFASEDGKELYKAFGFSPTADMQLLLNQALQ